MISEQEIQAEARELWEHCFSETGRASLYDGACGSAIEEIEKAAVLEARRSLQPWLHIFEESIQWLTNIWATLQRSLDKNGNSSLLLSVWALCGASCAHAVAVRRLVLSGLDTPARGAVRVLDEHLCACIAILNEPTMAEEFQSAQSPENADEFWYRKLNSKRIRKALNSVERSVNLDSSFSSDMREWRTSEIKTFSQALHPSYNACFMTVYTPTATDPMFHAIGVWGHASAASERTLNFACKSILYFAQLGCFMLFNEHSGNPPLLELDNGDEIHEMVAVGQNVLTKLDCRYRKYDLYHTEDDS